MAIFRKVAQGAVRSGLLFTGLLGLYMTRKKNLSGYMTFASCYIACVGLFTLAQYLLDDEFKKSKGKDKDSRTPETQDMAEAAETERVPVRKISREEFEKEVNDILIELNDTDSVNSTVTIRLPQLDLATLDTENADFEKIAELRQLENDTITMSTSPVKMKLLRMSIT